MKQIKCNYCHQTTHYSWQCFRKPRTPIKSMSDKYLNKHRQCRRLWFKENPPDSRGVWLCYLNIAPDCPIKLTSTTIRLEHVKSKARYPELVFEITNIKPACNACNALKGSLDIKDLVETYPHLEKYL